MNHMLRKTTLLFSLLVACSSLAQAQTEEEPLWELGLGLGGVHQPYYPGSDETRSFLFPVPVPIYRGNVLKSDDEGVRAELELNDRVKFNFSLDFNLSIDSDDIPVRTGMDDIDTQLQIGPSLEVNLKETEQSQWLLKVPVRASVGIGDGVNGNGYTFAPSITYFRFFNFRNDEWRFGAALGPQFGTSDYNNVYYGVEQNYVTPDRPFYQADGGYAGARGLLTLKSQNRKRLIVWFLRYDDISGAEFEDSPLAQTSGGASIGFVYSRFLWKSKKMVTR